MLSESSMSAIRGTADAARSIESNRLGTDTDRFRVRPEILFQAEADKPEPVVLRPILANMRGSPPVCDTNRCAMSPATACYSGRPGSCTVRGSLGSGSRTLIETLLRGSAASLTAASLAISASIAVINLAMR